MGLGSYSAATTGAEISLYTHPNLANTAYFESFAIVPDSVFSMQAISIAQAFATKCHLTGPVASLQLAATAL